MLGRNLGAQRPTGGPVWLEDGSWGGGGKGSHVPTSPDFHT
jgi:hypothetical protein